MLLGVLQRANEADMSSGGPSLGQSIEMLERQMRVDVLKMFVYFISGLYMIFGGKLIVKLLMRG